MEAFWGFDKKGDLVDSEDSDSGSDDVAITVEEKETVNDNINLNGNVIIHGFDTRLEGDLSSVGCLTICGPSTNICAFKYENIHKIERKKYFKKFESLDDMSVFLREMHKKYKIKMPANESGTFDFTVYRVPYTWKKWPDIAGAINPGMKNVCFLLLHF